MGYSITSVQSQRILRHLEAAGSERVRTGEKLASAQRINHAGDDAAGLAVSDRMKERVNGLEQARRNIQDGISMLQVAEGGIRSVQDYLQRMRTLCVQAASDTLTTADRVNIQYEMTQLTDEIERQSSTVTFAGRKLTGPVPNTPLPADVVFVVDTSGSMAGEIGNVLAGLNSLTSGLDNAGIQARYALMDVNDVREPVNGTNRDLNFTNAAGLSAALAALLPVTGSPVRNWDAIQATLPGGADAPTWDTSPPTLRFMIQLTDTTANEGGTVTNEAAQAANLLANNTTYFGVIDPLNAAQYDDLANQTGGQLYDVASADYSPLLNSIRNTIIATAVGYHMEDPRVIHVGANEDETITLAVPADARTTTLGVDGIDVTTRAGATSGITAIDTALDRVSGYLADIGAQQNRLESAMQEVSTSLRNTADARSKIRDTDFSQATMDYARQQMIEMGGQSALAQSHAQTAVVLQLLRG